MYKDLKTKQDIIKWVHGKQNEAKRKWATFIRKECRCVIYTAVSIAVKNGVIKKKPCEKCGRKKYIQAHHDNYNDPLNVVWLCRWCHEDLHKKIRKSNKKIIQKND